MGCQQVGGLGACTLIHRDVLSDGCRFRKVGSLPEGWGEDRHFCVRAQAKNWTLLADSMYPPFHIYRPSLIPVADEWLKAGCSREWFLKNWLDEEWKLRIKATGT